MQESRIKCGIPGGIKFSSQVGKVGSHHLRRDPAIPTWDPGWDCRDPAYIPPDILPGAYLVNCAQLLQWFASHFTLLHSKIVLHTFESPFLTNTYAFIYFYLVLNL